jgi:hypothetical protein
MTGESANQCAKPARSKKPDYIAAIIIHALFLVIVNQVLNWNMLSFLTQDFKQVLPIQNIQLAAVIAFNFIYLFYDRDWFTALSRIITNAIAIAVLTRYMAVFPFDFAAESFNWAPLVRVLFIIGIVGCSLAIIVDTVKLAGALKKGK